MYKRLFFYFTITLILLNSSVTFAQISAKIGEEPFTKNRSAVLEIQSANRGFLPPRMTHTQMNQIASPATGLVVYCTNCGPTSGQYRYFNGLEWVLFTGENSQTIGYPILGITTNISTATSTNSLTVESSVVEEGTYSIISRGFVSTSNSNESPTLTNRITQFSTQAGTGSFSSIITNLAESTTYNLRAYATVSNGTQTYTAYSNTIMVTTTGTAVPTITSLTGKVWMDRNLGASRAATGTSDALARGFYYQWGRRTDGHQIFNSVTRGSKVSSYTLADYRFITTPQPGSNWLDPINYNLWQGVAGINNPCPSGFRLPTSLEWSNEGTILKNDIAEILKIAIGGWREFDDGTIDYLGWTAFWTSNSPGAVYRSGSQAKGFSLAGFAPSYGINVRCIKD
jgi:hypothetical protein